MVSNLRPNQKAQSHWYNTRPNITFEILKQSGVPRFPPKLVPQAPNPRLPRRTKQNTHRPQSPNITAKMGCCGLFKSKKNKKKSKHNPPSTSQFAARPLEKYDYRPAGPGAQYSGGGANYQPAPHTSKPTSAGYRPSTAGSTGGGPYKKQGDPAFDARREANEAIFRSVGNGSCAPPPAFLPVFVFGSVFDSALFAASLLSGLLALC